MDVRSVLGWTQSCPRVRRRTHAPLLTVDRSPHQGAPSWSVGWFRWHTVGASFRSPPVQTPSTGRPTCSLNSAGAVSSESRSSRWQHPSRRRNSALTWSVAAREHRESARSRERQTHRANRETLGELGVAVAGEVQFENETPGRPERRAEELLDDGAGRFSGVAGRCHRGVESVDGESAGGVEQLILVGEMVVDRGGCHPGSRSRHWRA